jgi:hypothetical protein
MIGVTSSPVLEVDFDVIITKILDFVVSMRFEPKSGDIPEHGGTRNKFHFTKELSGHVSARSILTPLCSLMFCQQNSVV